MDALGGLSRAVAIAKQELKIPDSENVSLIELSREQMSPLMLLSGGASANVVSSIVQVPISLSTPCSFPTCCSSMAIIAGVAALQSLLVHSQDQGNEVYVKS